MVEDRDRNDSGQYEPKYTDEDVLDAVRKHEPAGTQEIADELGVVRQSADYRLRKLLKMGRVSKKKVGHSLVWMLDE